MFLLQRMLGVLKGLGFIFMMFASCQCFKTSGMINSNCCWGLEGFICISWCSLVASVSKSAQWSIPTDVGVLRDYICMFMMFPICQGFTISAMINSNGCWCLLKDPDTRPHSRTKKRGRDCCQLVLLTQELLITLLNHFGFITSGTSVDRVRHKSQRRSPSRSSHARYRVVGSGGVRASAAWLCPLLDLEWHSNQTPNRKANSSP